jgi:hypothetical protein
MITKGKTKICSTGTGFECKSSCGSCGTDKCQSYKAWWSKKLKANLEWATFVGSEVN